jgi:hypothetical protein
MNKNTLSDIVFYQKADLLAKLALVVIILLIVLFNKGACDGWFIFELVIYAVGGGLLGAIIRALILRRSGLSGFIYGSLLAALIRLMVQIHNASSQSMRS